jgi:hypothetical protein
MKNSSFAAALNPKEFILSAWYVKQAEWAIAGSALT